MKHMYDLNNSVMENENVYKLSITEEIAGKNDYSPGSPFLSDFPYTSYEKAIAQKNGPMDPCSEGWVTPRHLVL